MLPRIFTFRKYSHKTALRAVIVGVAVFLFLGLGFAYGADHVFAQSNTFGLGQFGQEVQLANADIRVIAARIIRAVLGLLGLIAVILIIYAGYTIMTAAGNEEKVTMGRTILRNAVIGLAIILSSLAIAQWVINALTEAINPSAQQSEGAPVFDTFAGSGALGKVVKDHYPFRDQIGVKRNTKIAVTFFEPIDPASVMENSNNTCWGANGDPVACDDSFKEPYYGDCLTDSPNFSYEKDCDHLKTGAVEIFDTQAENKELKNASVQALYEDGAARNVYTLVIKTFDYLGKEAEEVWHTVTLKNSILKKMPVNGKQVGIFGDLLGAPYYTWDFQTDGTLDQSPPFVVSVNPNPNSEAARNEYVQIHFNEAVDPTMVQGLVTEATPHNNLVFNTLDGADAAVPTGEWKISNGYKTVEFYSSEVCGQNSCGNPLYCLPLDCGDTACSDTSKNTYSVLVYSAELINPANTKSFESKPFSGVMDMSGNALDGPKPDAVAKGRSEGAQEDNHWWSFVILNKIDRSSPYLQRVLPGIDKENVVKDEKVILNFSRRMLFGTLYNVRMREFPDNVTSVAGEFLEFWSKPESEDFKNPLKLAQPDYPESTEVSLLHRVFGPNDQDFYYFPYADSNVLSSNGNCLYPGRGPKAGASKGQSLVCSYKEDTEGNPITGTGADCFEVKLQETNGEGVLETGTVDTGCVTTDDSVKAQPSTPVCLDLLSSEEVSPVSKSTPAGTPALPDLVVQDFSFSPAPSGYGPNTKNITITIRNNGTGIAKSPFWAQIYGIMSDGEVVEGPAYDDSNAPVGQLSSGQTVTFTYLEDIPASGLAGAVKVKVKADWSFGESYINESNENNNELTKDISLP